MEYKNITVKVDELSDIQKSDLRLAEILLANMNSLVDDYITLSYDGYKFSIGKFGNEYSWFFNDLKIALERKINLTIKFLTEKFQDELEKFNNEPDSPNRLPSFELFKRRFFTYYGKYPKNTFPEDGDAELISVIKFLESRHS